MHIRKVTISNIKSIEFLELDFDAPYAGWHVLLGDNGAGKSTILQAISLCLLGEKGVNALGKDLSQWITKNRKEGSKSFVKLDIIPSNRTLERIGIGKINYLELEIEPSGKVNSFYKSTANNKKQEYFSLGKEFEMYNAAFGPFRRVGEKESKNINKFSDSNFKNHITLFDYNYNLSDAVSWLQELQLYELDFAKKDPKFSEVYKPFQKIVSFINESKLLPNIKEISNVTRSYISFKNEQDNLVDLSEMSDGYKSMFSLLLEILSQIMIKNRMLGLFSGNEITQEGVILIDEVDIHLHPTWQAKIGNWFKKFFPNIQFIVTTHSPIVCQSAKGGSIWKITQANTEEEQAQKMEGIYFKRLVYGNILEAIGTAAFGATDFSRSEKSQEMLQRLGELSSKSIRGLTSKKEEEELDELSRILPTGDIDQPFK